jgi:hypothetical protein
MSYRGKTRTRRQPTMLLTLGVQVSGSSPRLIGNKKGIDRYFHIMWKARSMWVRTLDSLSTSWAHPLLLHSTSLR